MNRTDFCLDRLFRAAARVPEQLPAEAPFGLETKMMASWRRGLHEDGRELVVPLVRRAFLCACVILAITAGLTLRSFTDTPSNEMVTVDSVIQLTLLQ